MAISSEGPSEDVKTVKVEGEDWLAALLTGLERSGIKTPPGESGFSCLIHDEGIEVSHFGLNRHISIRYLDPALKSTGGEDAVVAAPFRPGAHVARSEPAPGAHPARPEPVPTAPSPVPSRLLFRRDEDRDERNAVTYRERLLAVEPGTPLPDVERLLRAVFAELREELRNLPPGKFIHITVFDYVFQGQPTRPALGALSWKDWRGQDADVTFPASMVRPKAAARPAPAAAKPGPPAAAAPAPEKPIPAAAKPIPPASATPAPEKPIPAAVAAPTAPVRVDRPTPPARAVRPAPPARRAAPVSEAVPAPAVAPSPVPRTEPLPGEPTPPPKPAASPASAPRAAPAEEPSLSRAPTLPAPEAVGKPIPATPPSGIPAVAPVASPASPAAALPGPAPEPLEPEATPPPGGGDRISWIPAPTQAGRQRKPSAEILRETAANAEDLLAEVFEAMQDLYATQTREEAARFGLTLSIQKVPCEAAAILLHDLATGELVYVAAIGTGTESLAGVRTQRDAGLIGAAVQAGEPVLVESPSDARLDADFDRLTGMTTRTAICAPIIHGGRVLGALQLVNRRGGKPFSSQEANVAGYVMDTLAEYLVSSLPELLVD